MQSLILIIHVVLAAAVIGLVLIQHGKGADAGAAFGSGASATVFGSRGSASFLTRMTTLMAALFFVTSLVLFYYAAHRDREGGSVMDSVVPAAVQQETSQEASEAEGVVDGPVNSESGAAADAPVNDGPVNDSAADGASSDMPTN